MKLDVKYLLLIAILAVLVAIALFGVHWLD